MLFHYPGHTFLLSKAKKHHRKHLRLGKLGKDQRKLKRGLGISLTDIIHLLRVSDSISLPNAQFQGQSPQHGGSPVAKPPPRTPTPRRARQPSQGWQSAGRQVGGALISSGFSVLTRAERGGDRWIHKVKMYTKAPVLDLQS